jgi:hypothetical protein
MPWENRGTRYRVAYGFTIPRGSDGINTPVKYEFGDVGEYGDCPVAAFDEWRTIEHESEVKLNEKQVYQKLERAWLRELKKINRARCYVEVFNEEEQRWQRLRRVYRA